MCGSGTYASGRRGLFALPMAAVLAALAAAGCGESGAPSGDVRGRVTFRASPVVSGNVVFEDAARGVLRMSALDSGGEYAISDVPVGDYTVSVQPLDPDLPNETNTIGPIRITADMIPDPQDIPKAVRTSQASPLRATIGVGANEHDFELTSLNQ